MVFIEGIGWTKVWRKFITNNKILQRLTKIITQKNSGE